MEQELSEQQKRQIALVAKLGQLEEFKVWRDLVFDDAITQVEGQLRASDTLPEGILRGTIKHYFSLKNIFHDVFSVAEAETKRIQEETAEAAQENSQPDNQL